MSDRIDYGRAISPEEMAENGKDPVTKAMCSQCLKFVDTARVPYVAARCFKCWGMDANDFWRTWMQHEFFAALKFPTKRRSRIIKTLRIIESVLRIGPSHYRNIKDGAANAYMQGEFRTDWREWNQEIFDGLVDIAQRLRDAPEAGGETQQLRLNFFTPEAKKRK